MNRKRPVFVLISLFLQGCCGQRCEFHRMLEGDGGGQDVLTSDLPFTAGYGTQCVQGAEGSYSHTYRSTKFDLDLDTPNNRSDPVFAPMDGTLYVNDDGPTSGFGKHANLSLGDGTYLLMGHLKDIFVPSGSRVVAGQLIGFEGSTGNSQGDHVHFGRHSGRADRSAGEGSSLDGFSIRALNLTTGEDADFLTTETVCSLTAGHVYESLLETPHWHPPGSLVKTPDNPVVYLTNSDNTLSVFGNEDAFLSRGYDFRDVALISDEELHCYGQGPDITTHSRVRAVKDSAGKAWLLMGEVMDSARFRLSVDELGAVSVLLSYGIRANGFDDIDYGDDAEMNSYPVAGTATYRDGALIETEDDTVYAMDNGLAMPLKERDLVRLLGFAERMLIPVTDEELTVVTTGSCYTDTYCITKEDITQCGGPVGEEGSYEEDHQAEQDLPEGGDTGPCGDPPVDGAPFILSWTTPGGLAADWVTLAGSWTRENGEVTPWEPMLAETLAGATVVYTENVVHSGDSLRFSGAYGRGSVESWTCLAPFPPGILQGTITALLGNQTLPVIAIGDPDSAGCGLKVEIP